MDYRTKCKIRSALAVAMLVLVAALLIMMPFMGVALAEGADELHAVEPFTWESLCKVSGCAVFVLLFVQATKKLLDKLIVIPTTLYAYVIAVITMLAATAFTGELTLSSGLLTLFNGWLVSATASKSYDVIAGK